jgi:hypothetical protein
MTTARFVIGDSSVQVTVERFTQTVPNRVAGGSVAFDASAFDPRNAAEFVMFWSQEGIGRLRGPAMLRAVLTPKSFDLTWPEWIQLGVDQRERLLREVVRPFGRVVVNGHQLAHWTALRELLGRGPSIRRNA